MTINFDKAIDRRRTHSMKWDDMMESCGVSSDATPMWVADMDFLPPPSVQTALETMAQHGIYGYFGNDTPYKHAISGWMQRRHGWEVDPDTILTANGLVNGTSICVNSFTEKGDGVLLFTPVYHAFARVIKGLERKVVECPLVIEDGRYVMDFDHAETLAQHVKMVVFCSPHNPGGRVWSVEEQQKLAEFCARHNLILVSDEIHHDLVFEGATHTVLPNAAPDHMDRIVMLTAATKSFNIAGTHTGNIIVHDPKLRGKIQRTMTGWGIGPNAFGMRLVEAAYRSGDAWMDQCVAYLDENRKLLDAAIEEIPGLQSMPMQSTYLAWVDFSKLGMPQGEYLSRVQDQAKIAVNRGETFGKGGETYLRFNFATQRTLLLDAIERLKEAFSDLQ